METTSSTGFPNGSQTHEEICEKLRLGVSSITDVFKSEVEESLRLMSNEGLHSILQKIIEIGFKRVAGTYFGSFVLQEILNQATEKSYTSLKSRIGEQLKGQVEDLVMQNQRFSAFVVKTWIRHWKDDETDGSFVFQELAAVPSFVSLCLSSSWFVVQNAIEKNPAFFGPFCANRLQGQVCQLVSSRNFQILKSLLYLCPGVVEEAILSEISPYTDDLVKKENLGVLEQALKVSRSSASASRIIQDLLVNFCYYATGKYSSRLMQQLVVRLQLDERLDELLDKLMAPCDLDWLRAKVANIYRGEIPRDISWLCCLMLDDYGTWVIKTVLEKSSESQQERICNHSTRFLSIIESDRIGRESLSRIDRDIRRRCIIANVEGGVVVGEENRRQREMVPPQNTGGSRSDTSHQPPPLLFTAASSVATTPSSMVMMNDPVILARVTQKAVDTVETDIATTATRLRWVSPSMGAFQSSNGKQQDNSGSHDLHEMYMGLLKAKVDLLGALSM